jgi:prevent-host-death family protein
MTTYSLYEAKARFSEVIRLVREGRTVTITYRGKPVARIQPIQAESSEFEQRLRRFEDAGVLQAAEKPTVALKPVARRAGALGRFLAEREE